MGECGRLFMPTCILILSSVHHCVLIHVTPTWSARTLAKQGSMRLCAVLYGPFPVAQFATLLFRLHSTLSTPLRSFSALRQRTPLDLLHQHQLLSKYSNARISNSIHGTNFFHINFEFRSLMSNWVGRKFHETKHQGATSGPALRIAARRSGVMCLPVGLIFMSLSSTIL